MKLEEAKGNWALVTGASSGIGREFALQLAAVGMNMVLVARRKPLLDILGSKLSQRYEVRALILPVDLSRTNAISEIRSHLVTEGVKVRMLVNNAAFGRWGRFEATPAEVYEEMIRLNEMAMVSLCHHFLEDLSSFPTSVIINVSSPAAYNPIPYMAVYAATKAFVSSFSQALYGEWRDRGVLVQTLVPGPTETEFDTVAGAYASALKGRESTDTVVKTSLAHLAGDAPLVITAKGTYKQRVFTALFPVKMVIKTVARMFQPPKGN
ncbi:MAG: SDR family NAD(P)-dependent oxidoreductase [Desulfobacterales bacterium]|nr:SDR family NAD(P)-dependent oxidoreductase [Desulfobacterales bacterium]